MSFELCAKYAFKEDAPANEITRMAQEKLSELEPKRPFFLFLHYLDPHFPYTPPAPYDSESLNGVTHT